MKNGLLSIVNNNIPTTIAKGTIGLVSSFSAPSFNPRIGSDLAQSSVPSQKESHNTYDNSYIGEIANEETLVQSLKTSSHTMINHLKHSGFEVKEITEQLAPDHPTPIDQGIIDLRGYALNEKKAKRITQQIPNPHTGMTFIVDDKIEPAIATQLQKYGYICFGDLSLANIAVRCQQSQRMQNIRQEVLRRQKTFKEFKKRTTLTEPNNSQTKPDILIAAAPGPDTLSIINKIKNIAGTIYCAYRPGQAIRALENKNIDCAIFLPEQAGDPLFALTRAMKRHNRYQNIPVALIIPDKEDQLKNTPPSNIIYRSQASAHIATTIQSMISEAHHLRSLNAYLRQIGTPIFRERVGRDFSAQFFSKHASTMCDDADIRGHNIRFLGLKVYPEGNSGMTAQQTSYQVAPLINRVIRAEDFFARLNTRDDSVTYGILLNNIDRRSANKIAGRIIGVIQNTMFNNNAGNPITFEVDNALFRRPKGMCLEESIAGLMNNMRR